MKRKINVNDILKNRVVSNLKTNGGGTYGLFFSSLPNLEMDDYDKELYKINLHSFEIKQVNLDCKPDEFYICYEQIIFKKVKEKQTELYTFNLHTNETHLMSVLPFQVKDLHIIGEFLYFTAILEELPEGNFYEGIPDVQIPIYQNNVEKKVHYLFKSDLMGKQIVLLNETGLDVDQVHFDHKYKRIMYTAFRIQPIKPVISDVYTYEINEDKTIKWTDGHYRIGYIGSLSKDKMIFMGTDLRKYSRNDNQDHYIIDREQKEYQLLTSYKDQSNERSAVALDSSYQIDSPVSVKNEVFYYVALERFSETLKAVDGNGNQISFACDLRTIDTYLVLDKGILIAGLTADDLQELYWLENGKLTKLSTFNDWLKEKEISKPLYIEGAVDGWVIPPLEIKEGEQYPGVLLIHGGPKAIYTDVLTFEAQILAAKGYFVMYCNPRGSDGRGNDFSNIRGAYGEYAYEDGMNFVDRMMEKFPQIDSERLGVSGGSYGGYMTNLIITKTTRFKAAVSERGISHMMTGFLSSDIGFQYVFEYMGNGPTPWTDQELYNRASPLTDANKVKTPTLFAHGKSDWRCHYLESLNMYNALLYHGVETKISLYEGESHNFVVRGKPSNRLNRYTELLDWLQLFLQGEQNNEIS